MATDTQVAAAISAQAYQASQAAASFSPVSEIHKMTRVAAAVKESTSSGAQ